MTLTEMNEKRRQLVADARAINDRAGAEKRAMTAEENANFDAAMTDAAALKDSIEAQRADEEKAMARTAQLTAHENELRAIPNRYTRAIESQHGTGLTDNRVDESADWNRTLRAWAMNDTRAIQADSLTQGGYLLPPAAFISTIIQGVDNMVVMRQLAHKETVQRAQSLGCPTLVTDLDDPTWTSELAIGSEATSIAFGRRELTPHPLAQLVKISNVLLGSSTNIEKVITDRVIYKMGTVQENGFLNGDGSGEPLGVFTASIDGITTSRDVSTGNSTTAITFDGLKSARGALKPQYRQRNTARWLFHRDAITAISKLKDGEGRYLWAESVRTGEPDVIMGTPVIESEYAPNTFTTGLYVGLLGDFSNYWIADALSLTLQRLQELYAATNQTGFVARAECDGMPVLAEAFVRVKLA